MLYDVFAYILILEGLATAAYLFTRAWHNRGDWGTFVNLIVGAICGLYISAVYISVGPNSLSTALTIGVYIRPALMLLLLLPSMIVWRAKI